MLAFFETKEFWAAIIVSAATLLAVWVAVSLGLRTLRDTEISRLRIKCVVDLISFRFVLIDQAMYQVTEKAKFYAALNAIPGLFGNNDDVMRFLRDFREEESHEKNNALVRLIQTAAHSAGVPLAKVSNTDLLRPFY